MDITPLALGTFIVLVLIQGCDSQCTFPSSIWGTWIRERDGRNFTISSNSFQGFNYYSGTQFYNDFRCQSINGATYVIVQDLPRAYTVDNQFVYLCFSIEVFGANSFLMTDLANISSKISVSDVDLTLVNGFVDIDPTLTALDVCAFQPAEVRSAIMYRSGKGDIAGEMAVTCPSIIHGNYNYTLDGTKCTGNSSFAVCPGRTTAVIDYSQCADQVAYSTSGVLECMGSVTRGANTYLWTWIGTGTFSSTTIRTVCFALEDSSGTVLASYTPQDCLVNQVASSVSPGGILSMVPLELCPITTSEEEGNIAAIAGGAVVGVLLLIAIAVVVVVLLMKKRNKKLNTVQADVTKSAGPSKTPTSNGKTPSNGHVKHVTIAAPAVVTNVNETFTSTSTKKSQNTADKSQEKSKESPSKVQDNPKSESKPSEPTTRPPADPKPSAATPASTKPVTISSTSAAASSPAASSVVPAAAITVTAAAAGPTVPPTAATNPAPSTPGPTAADAKTTVTVAPKTEPTPPSGDTTAAPTTSATVSSTAAAPTVENTPAAPAAATAAAVATTAAASPRSPVKSKQADPPTTEVKSNPEDSSQAPEDKEEKTKKKKKKKKKDKKKSE